MSAHALPEFEDEVTCVLVPLANEPLLIPNVCVAEVLPWRRTKPLSGVAPWCVGVLGWRGQSVVVMDFERYMGIEVDAAARRAMVVMKKSHHLDGDAFYALATAGLPRLMHIREQELSQRDEALLPGVSMLTTLGTEDAVIPNLQDLEEQIRQIL